MDRLTKTLKSPDTYIVITSSCATDKAAWRTPKILMQRFCIRMWILILNAMNIWICHPYHTIALCEQPKVIFTSHNKQNWHSQRFDLSYRGEKSSLRWFTWLQRWTLTMRTWSMKMTADTATVCTWTSWRRDQEPVTVMALPTLLPFKASALNQFISFQSKNRFYSIYSSVYTYKYTVVHFIICLYNINIAL